MTENITVNEQNSIRISTAFGAIYVDPFHITESSNDAAFIFITHDHYDHFSPDDIAKVVGKNTVLVCPEKMKKKANEVSSMVSRIETVTPSQSYTIDGIEFETVPAYNLLKPFHTKGAGWVGYIFVIDGKRIYVAGDMDATKEARAVRCDVAIVPIGGFYTMDPQEAAELINAIKPSVAIPVHYGKVVGKPEYGKKFAANVNSPTKVEFKIEF